MRTLLGSLFLAFALLLSQQGALAHEMAHAVAGAVAPDAHPDAPDAPDADRLCPGCLAAAMLAVAMPSSGTTLRLAAGVMPLAAATMPAANGSLAPAPPRNRGPPAVL